MPMYPRALQVLLLITLLLLLSGCNTQVGNYMDEAFHDKHEVPYRRGYQVPPLTTSDPKHYDLSDNRLNPRAFRADSCCETLYDIAALRGESTDPDTAQAARNELQDAMIGLSEQVGSKHVAGILFGEDQFNLWLGLGDLTFDALAVIVTPPGTKTAFSAVSALFGGTRALANAEIYKKVFGDAIVRAIIHERRRLLVLIRDKQAKGVDEYPVGQAISDAIAYHEAASFYSGMTLVQSDLNRGQIQREETIQRILDRRAAPLPAPPSNSARLSDLYAAIASTDREEKLRVDIGEVYETTAALRTLVTPPLFAGFDFNGEYQKNKIARADGNVDADLMCQEAFMVTVNELYAMGGDEVLERVVVELSNTLFRNTKPE